MNNDNEIMKVMNNEIMSIIMACVIMWNESNNNNVNNNGIMWK